jgi:methionine sulfoxide reductase heme-binding subunit
MGRQPATPSSDQLGGRLGTSRGWRRRLLLHHVPLALASAVGVVVFIGLSPAHGGISVSQLVVATGYVALGLLGLTLLIGPANLLLRRRNPVNNYLRRDVGTWTAIWSVVHVIVGLQGHESGVFAFVDYFVADGRPLTNSFGMGNWTGLAATVIVVLLLVLSTDRHLRELKSRRWKDLQRLNYTLFALVVLHAVYYGALRRMTSPYTRLLLITVIAVLLGQAAGIWLWRRKERAPTATEVPSRERQSAGSAR